jgi:hypothetical protein
MTMPAKHRLWLGQWDCALPMANEPCQEDHEPALVRLEARPRNRSRGDNELLAEKRVLRDELLARPKRFLDESDQERRWPGRGSSGAKHRSRQAGDDASNPSTKRRQHPRDCGDPGEPFKSRSARFPARSWGGCE